LPLAILMIEYRLAAVAHSKAAVPPSAKTGRLELLTDVSYRQPFGLTGTILVLRAADPPAPRAIPTVRLDGRVIEAGRWYQMGRHRSLRGRSETAFKGSGLKPKQAIA